jgi:hypothetical protein
MIDAEATEASEASNVRPARAPAATTDRMGTGTMLLPVSEGGCRPSAIEPDEPTLSTDDLRPPRAWPPRITTVGVVALAVAALVVVAAVMSGVHRTATSVAPAEPDSAPSLMRAISAAPVRALPTLSQSPALPIPPTVDQLAARSLRRDSVSAPRAPVTRRRKQRPSPARTLPPDAIEPLPEVHTNVPIPD